MPGTGTPVADTHVADTPGNGYTLDRHARNRHTWTGYTLDRHARNRHTRSRYTLKHIPGIDTPGLIRFCAERQMFWKDVVESERITCDEKNKEQMGKTGFDSAFVRRAAAVPGLRKEKFGK